MGFPKALLDYRGAPFLVRILEACVALEVKHRVVVLGDDAQRIKPALAGHDCIVVENPEVDRGPIHSLRLALAALRAVTPRGVLAWPVDFPHVRIATVERLLDVHGRSNPPVVAPLFAGRRGHPVLWDASAFPAIEQDSEAERIGARAVVRALGDAAVAVPVDDPAVTDELNTPEDYERLIRQINRDVF
jgi:CTP:molybdopterin cytidylyltransferase MocA